MCSAVILPAFMQSDGSSEYATRSERLCRTGVFLNVCMFVDKYVSEFAAGQGESEI